MTSQIRCVTYRRVSTDEQKTGTGLEYQRDKCREYARQHGFEIVVELADEGVSAGKVPIAERPGGAELYRLVSEHAVDAVVATRADRLSRDEWGVELPLFHKHCALNDVSLHLADEGGAVSKGIGGKLQLTITDMSAGEERKKYTQRQTDGRRLKARKGILLVCGRAPFGYRLVPIASDEPDEISGSKLPHFKLVIDEMQATIVHDIFRLFVYERWSLRAIALHFTEKRIPAPEGRWWRQALRRYLRNRRYIGEFTYAGIAISRPDLAIIDRATFDRAQQLLATNKQNSPRRTKYEYLFRSRLLCECGRKMRGQPMHGGRYLKYVCTAVDQENARCSNTKTTDARYLDSAGWAELLKVLNNVELLKRSARKYMEQQTAQLKPKRERLERLVSERDEADRMANKYVQLAGRAKLDSELLAEYERNAASELTRRKRLDHEIETLKAELSHVARYDEREIEKVVEEVRRKLTHGAPAFAQKRQLVDRLNVTGKLEGEKVKFTLEIGLTFKVARSVSPPFRSCPTYRAVRQSG